MLDTQPITPAHALCVYAEPIIVGRRVAVLGDASLGLSTRLIDLGARLVHVYDPSAERARLMANTQLRGVTVRELPSGEFDVRDGAFDVALVPDLGAFENQHGLVARLRRLVGGDGVLMVAARNAQVALDDMTAPITTTAALDYYELYDLISMQFEAVRMVGQVPFIGVTLAELGGVDEAPQVSVDTQLVVAPHVPEVFIAVGSSSRVATLAASRLDAYAIVQLPAHALAAMPSVRLSERGSEDAQGVVEAHKAALAAAVLRGDLLTSELDETRADLQRASVVSNSTTDDERAHDLYARASDGQSRSERLTQDLARTEEELERQREMSFRLVREVDEEKKARQRAELELGTARQRADVSLMQERVAELQSALRAAANENRELTLQNARLVEDAALSAAAVQHEIQPLAADATVDAIVRFEEVLLERSETIQVLEQEVARRELMVRELTVALEEAREPAEPNASLSDVARAQVEADARAKALSELSAEIADANTLRANASAQLVEMRARLDDLALETARREAELQVSSWRIAELEQLTSMLDEKVNQAEARHAAAPDVRAPSDVERAEIVDDEGMKEKHREIRALAARLALAEGERLQREDELAVLRRALAQEHAARVRLELDEVIPQSQGRAAAEQVTEQVKPAET
jgi:hypothetical protein